MDPATSEPGRPADDGGYAAPYPPAPAVEPAPRPARGRAVAVAAGTVLALTALGAPLGLLWFALAPRVPVVKTPEGVFPAGSEPEEVIAGDGWYTLLGLGFGLLAAIAVWLLLRHRRGPAGLLVTVLGCIGAAVVAWQLGRHIGLSHYQHVLAATPVGQTLTSPVDLRSGRFQLLFHVVPVLRGALLAPPLAAAVTYTLLAGWSRWPSLRPEPEPDAGLSWD